MSTRLNLKSLLLTMLAVLIVSAGAAAQTNHPATLNWAASTSTITGYNVYRGNCTGTVTNGVCSQEATASLVGQVPMGTLSFTDSPLTAGSSLYWYVTAYVNSATQTGESSATNHVAAVVPKDVVVPNPPSGLSLTVK